MAQATSVPVRIVRGRPRPSSRLGTLALRRSRPRSTRTASVKSRRPRVASATCSTNRLARLEVDQMERPVADEKAQGDEHHRLGDERALQP